MIVLALAAMTAQAALSAPEGRSFLGVLRTAFGSVAEHGFREPQVVVAPTSAATWELSDEVVITNQAVNPRTGQLWARADPCSAR